MTNGTEAVRERYAISGILDRVNAFLLERGIDRSDRPMRIFFPSINSTGTALKPPASISSALVSDVVRQLVAGKGFSFHQIGAEILKGLRSQLRYLMFTPCNDPAVWVQIEETLALLPIKRRES